MHRKVHHAGFEQLTHRLEASLPIRATGFGQRHAGWISNPRWFSAAKVAAVCVSLQCSSNAILRWLLISMMLPDNWKQADFCRKADIKRNTSSRYINGKKSDARLGACLPWRHARH
jgi:hypothetical protein